jgi:putative phosphoesterase
MSSRERLVWPVEAANVAVLADCHIHPGGGPAFPPELFDALQGCDLIVALGDMGECDGLDQLARIAPVIGVRGADDADDPRTAAQVLVLTCDTRAIGAVFDPKAAGLAVSCEPFEPVPEFAKAAERLFGRPIDALLYASTHRASVEPNGHVAMFNPGSAVLPAEGARPSFLKLEIGEGELRAEIAYLD